MKFKFLLMLFAMMFTASADADMDSSDPHKFGGWYLGLGSGVSCRADGVDWDFVEDSKKLKKTDTPFCLSFGYGRVGLFENGYIGVDMTINFGKDRKTRIRLDKDALSSLAHDMYKRIGDRSLGTYNFDIEHQHEMLMKLLKDDGTEYTFSSNVGWPQLTIKLGYVCNELKTMFYVRGGIAIVMGEFEASGFHDVLDGVWMTKSVPCAAVGADMALSTKGKGFYLRTELCYTGRAKKRVSRVRNIMKELTMKAGSSTGFRIMVVF